jgi:hypothetical protein
MSFCQVCRHEVPGHEPNCPILTGEPQMGMLSQSAHAAQDTLWTARQTIASLRRQLSAQQRYLAELEAQLEPNVVEEIRTELEIQDQNQ